MSSKGKSRGTKRKSDADSNNGASSSSTPAASASSSSSVSLPAATSALLRIQPSQIKNKAKRQELWLKVKSAKETAKSKEKKKRKKDIEENGPDAVAVKKQKTLDNTREADETIVAENDEEVVADESQDEFSRYFSGEATPKIIITSSPNPSKIMYEFISDLLHVFPNSFYYARKNFTIQQILTAARKRDYTDLLIFNEDKKTINALTHVHLPEGPTAYYKLTNLVLSKDIPGHGRPTSHRPEVIINNFTTRLGHRVGRMLASLLHQEPNFVGRRVVTFHNQRDFIFFRHHRYIFENKEKARLQPLGPQFTLKLRWLQHGLFDSQQGEMEWIHKKEMDTSRRRFFL